LIGSSISTIFTDMTECCRVADQHGIAVEQMVYLMLVGDSSLISDRLFLVEG